MLLPVACGSIYRRVQRVMAIIRVLNPTERLMFLHLLPALFGIFKRAVIGFWLDTVLVQIKSKDMVFVHIYPFIVEIALSWMCNLEAIIYVVILDSFSIYIRLQYIHQLFDLLVYLCSLYIFYHIISF